MKTFREHIDESFFVITSDNYQSISNSHLYGYCFYNGGLIRDCDIDDSTAIGSDLPGCYIAVKKTENGIHIVQIAHHSYRFIISKRIITGLSAILSGSWQR